MKKTTQNITKKEIKTHRELLTLTHKEIDVSVDIDYAKGCVSLIEKPSSFGSKVEIKKWVFGERSLPYMDSWINIIEAMGEAVRFAKTKLEDNLAKNTAFKIKNNIITK